MLLREITRKIRVDVRRNPSIRFFVSFFVDLTPMEATVAAAAMKMARYNRKLWIGAGVRSAAYSPGC